MIGIFWEKYFVMILTAAIGTIGYCLNINVKRNKIVYGCIGGVVSTFLYCVCVDAELSLLVQNLIPAAVVTLYAEVLARIVKAPATVFFNSVHYTIGARGQALLHNACHCRRQWGGRENLCDGDFGDSTWHSSGNCGNFFDVLSCQS